MSENTSRFPQLLVSMPRHNGERYARLMVEQFKQMNAMLGKTRWYELFGTPERTTRTLLDVCDNCGQDDCSGCQVYEVTHGGDLGYDALLEWLRGDAE